MENGPLRPCHADHHTPVAAGNGHQTQQHQADLRVHRRGQGQREADDDVRHHVGHEFAEDDMHGAQIQGTSGLHEVALFERKRLGAHGAQQRGPTQETEEDTQKGQIVESDKRGQHGQQREQGNRQHDIRDGS